MCLAGTQTDESSIAEVACLGGIEDVQVPRTPAGVEVVNTATVSKFTLPSVASRLPEEKAWLGFLSGGGQTWLTALLMSPSVVRGMGLLISTRTMNRSTSILV